MFMGKTDKEFAESYYGSPDNPTRGARYWTAKQIQDLPFSHIKWAAEFVCMLYFGNPNPPGKIKIDLMNNWFFPLFVPAMRTSGDHPNDPAYSKEFSWDGIFKRIELCVQKNKAVYNECKEYKFCHSYTITQLKDGRFLSTEDLAERILYPSITYMEFYLLQCPPPFADDAIRKGHAVALGGADELLSIAANNNGYIPNESLFSQCDFVLNKICTETKYPYHIAKYGSPAERMEYDNIAYNKMLDTPMTFWESTQAHPMTKKYMSQLFERTKKAAKKYSREVDIPESYIEYTPEGEKASGGFDFSKIKEYAPFVGLGLGIYRVLQG